jgi:hypothetical protein
VTQQERLADGPVRDRSYEAGGTSDLAMLVDQEELEHAAIVARGWSSVEMATQGTSGGGGGAL